MPWYKIWDTLKSKVCRYFLKRYLGQFLDESLNLEQLKVELCDGTAAISNVTLQVKTLNELLEAQGWPLEFTSVHIGYLSVNVPWNSLMTNDSSIEACDVTIHLRPVYWTYQCISMLESMWSSASSSLQLAEECMKQAQDDTETTGSIIGLEKFAETIDNVLNRIRAKITNIVIMFEYPLKSHCKDVTLYININEINYKNESGNEHNTCTNSHSENNTAIETYNLLPAFAKHNIAINEIKVFIQDSNELENQSEFYRTIEEIERLLILHVSGQQSVQIRVKQSEDVPGPKVSFDVELGYVKFFLMPHQINVFINFSKAFYEDKDNDHQKNEMIQSCTSNITTKDSMFSCLSNSDSILDSQYEVTTFRKLQNTKSNMSIYEAKFQEQFQHFDLSSDISHFTVKVAALMGIVFHEDISVDNSIIKITKEYDWNAATKTEFLKLSKLFFAMDNVSPDNFNFCKKNYLHFHLKTIVIDGKQQRRQYTIKFHSTVSINALDVFEVLNGEAWSLFTFVDNKEPQMTMVISSITDEYQKDMMSQIDITLQNHKLELDISMYDRLSALFKQDGFNYETKDMEFNRTNEIKIGIKCCELQLKFRFPIVNSITLNKSDADSWRLRNVREDYFLLNFVQFQLKKVNFTTEVIFAELNVFYIEKFENEKIMFLKVRMCEDSAKYKNNYPRLLLQLSSNAKVPSASELNRCKPFSSKRSWRQSNNSFIKNDFDESQTILIPGDTHELRRFCQNATAISKLTVDINFPLMDIFFESKDIYEVIYNRLNGDLFMWEPCSPYIVDNCKLKNLSPENKSYLNHETNELSNCSIDVLIKRAYITFYTPVRDEEQKILSDSMGKFFIVADGLKIFNFNDYTNMNLSYICIQISNTVIYHCDNTSTKFSLNVENMNNIEEFMQPTLYEVPVGLTKGLNMNNEEREMISLVIEIKKNLSQRIKRLKITSGIKGMALCYNPTSHTWLTQLIDFLDVTDYPIEGYQPFGVITELQLHFWDCAIDFRPKNYFYRAVVEVVYFLISSNIISSITSANIRFVIEEGLISIAPLDENCNVLPANKITFIKCDDLVPILDLGLLDISMRLNKETSDKNPKLDLRCSMHDVHMRTCYDSGSAFAQLIAYIANNAQTKDCDKNLQSNSTNHNTVNTDVQLNTCQILQQTNMSAKKQYERVHMLLADAVQDTVSTTNEYHDLDAESLSNGDCYEFYSPQPSKRTNSFNDIINFESNILDPTDYNTDSEEDTEILPQIKADLGEIVKYTSNSSISCSDSSTSDDYCIIAEEMPNCNKVKLSHEPLRIVDNHFCIPTHNNDLLRPPDNFPTPECRYILCEMTFTWHLYGGQDFVKLVSKKDQFNTPYKTEMSDMYCECVAGIKASDSKSNNKPKERITWKTSGGKNRNHSILVEIQLTKIRFTYEKYPLCSKYASRQVLLINEIEIRDRLQSSDINKLLYSPNIKSFANKNIYHMVIIKALHIKSNPNIPMTQECSLRISLLPIRLHIDQDTLEFLLEFFINLRKEHDTMEIRQGEKSIYLQNAQMPICNNSNDAVYNADDVNDLFNNHPIDELSALDIEDKSDNPSTSHSKGPIYFHELIFSPAVVICFDYHGRRVIFSKGPIAGLLMGLGQLQCSQITLKKISYRRGLLGFEKLLHFMCKEWLHDIKRNQLPKILKGIGPTYAFVQLFQGIYDLIWLPIESYQKDGKVIRGIQLAAQSFSARTIFAAIELTSRLIQILQFTAETALDIVSPQPSLASLRRTKRDVKKRLRRPKDIREGVIIAYQIVKEGFNDSASNLVEIAKAEHNQRGMTGAVGAVIRQVPQLVVCPAVIATHATSNILGGVKNSLLPTARYEATEKWKDDNI